MRMPYIKKGMTPFVGCSIGEPRLGLLPKWFESDKTIQGLFNRGFLSATTEDGMVWLALTEKGKRHVMPREKYWSQL